MTLASDLIQRVQIGARALESSIIQGVGSASEFIRKNPVTSGVSVAGGVLAGATVIQIIRKKRKSSRKAKKKTSRARAKKRKSKRKVSRGKHKRVHKHRVKKGLDVIHRGKKKGISLKTIRAAIASPKTPPHLKKGLRKLLRKRSR